MLRKNITKSRGLRPGRLVRTRSHISSPMDVLASSSRLSLGGVGPSPEAAAVEVEPEVKSNTLAAKMSASRATSLTIEEVLTAKSVDIDILREHCWTGIPEAHRADAWLLLLGVVPHSKSRREHTLHQRILEYTGLVDQYNALLPQQYTTEQNKYFKQIDLDMPRTNPSSHYFKSPRVMKALRRILCIYTIRHPATGYVQGMNDLIVVLFYVFLNDVLMKLSSADDALEVIGELDDQLFLSIETKAFRCLGRILEGIQDHFIMDQPGIQVKLYFIQSLISTIDRIYLLLYNTRSNWFVAVLHEHFDQEMLDYNMFAYRWMICFLVRQFDISHVVRLWDTYLVEENKGTGNGFGIFHVYVCASYILSLSSLLKTLDMEETLQLLQDRGRVKLTHEEVSAIIAQAFVYQNLYKLEEYTK